MNFFSLPLSRQSALAIMALLLMCASLGSLRAVTDDPNAPEPTPPRDRPWTPLEHLAFDPKVTSLPQGFSRGKTEGPPQYTGHRFIDDVGGSGWGWIKSHGAIWNNSAKWCALLETPGVVISPSRSFKKPDGDLNYEYELWGHWAHFTAYDARTDERLPIFILEGWRVIGLEPALDLGVGLPTRRHRSGTGAASRSSNPILTDPGVD